MLDPLNPVSKDVGELSNTRYRGDRRFAGHEYKPMHDMPDEESAHFTCNSNLRIRLLRLGLISLDFD